MLLLILAVGGLVGMEVYELRRLLPELVNYYRSNWWLIPVPIAAAAAIGILVWLAERQVRRGRRWIRRLFEGMLLLLATVSLALVAWVAWLHFRVW